MPDIILCSGENEGFIIGALKNKNESPTFSYSVNEKLLIYKRTHIIVFVFLSKEKCVI